MSKSKKSQMEILGLAVVVVLIVLGFLLYLIFGIRGEDYVEKIEEFTEPKMASSMLNAMLKTTVECGTQKYSVTGLLQDCYNWKMITCGGLDSCQVANNTIEFMLNGTLKDWKKGYWFEVTAGTLTDITLNYTDCTKLSRQRKPALQPIPIMSGTLNVSLGICD